MKHKLRFLFIALFILSISFLSLTSAQDYKVNIQKTGNEQFFDVNVNDFQKEIDLDPWYEDILEPIGLTKDEKINETRFRVEICSNLADKKDYLYLR